MSKELRLPSVVSVLRLVEPLVEETLAIGSGAILSNVKLEQSIQLYFATHSRKLNVILELETPVFPS